jgi:nicotinamide phosphoribosyltransferase
MFFGAQFFVKKFLLKPVTAADVAYAKERVDAHMGPGVFNEAGWMHIVNKHGGKLPLRIRIVPEGTVLSTRNVLMTIENTDDECPWLTNYVETLMVEVWDMCTVATNSREFKRLFRKYLKRTGDEGGIAYKVHDFGFRGVGGPEIAGQLGLAHLAAGFAGTDTFEAVEYAKDYYHINMAGESIPATEHSTITSWGREREVDAVRNFIRKWGHKHHYACVGDSYDIYNFCENIVGGVLKQEILAAAGTFVVRPDSGDMLVVVPKCLEILGRKFGYTTNEKGYKVLHPKVRMIQGDGIDLATAECLLYKLEELGWSADNLAMGSGGGLLQKFDRDTCKYAFKCSWAFTDQGAVEVYKDPITDPGKKSKRGRLKLITTDHGQFITVSESDARKDQMVDLFLNGDLMTDDSLEVIRARSA